MSEKVKQETQEVTAPVVGNSLALFLVPILANQGWIEIAGPDKSMEVAAGGAIVTYALLKTRQVFRWAGRLIERTVG